MVHTWSRARTQLGRQCQFNICLIPKATLAIWNANTYRREQFFLCFFPFKTNGWKGLLLWRHPCFPSLSLTLSIAKQSDSVQSVCALCAYTIVDCISFFHSDSQLYSNSHILSEKLRICCSSNLNAKIGFCLFLTMDLRPGGTILLQ